MVTKTETYPSGTVKDMQTHITEMEHAGWAVRQIAFSPHSGHVWVVFERDPS